MAENILISREVPPIPEFRGNLSTWISDTRIWTERLLRDHLTDLQRLNTKINELEGRIETLEGG